MSDLISKVKNDSRGRSKIIVAVSIVAVILVTIVTFLLLRSTLFLYLAVGKVQKNDFASARTYVSYLKDDEKNLLSDYIDFRLEINRNYTTMLVDFDRNTINSWKDKAFELNRRCDGMPNSISSETGTLYNKLNSICMFLDEYDTLRPEVLDMMDVFVEINRLYSNDETGKRMVFTIAGERKKVDSWEKECEALNAYCYEIPGGDTVYLLSYLISEARGEFDDIRNAMDRICANGYSETDTVRVSGEGTKVFSDVVNSSGDTVNIARKEEYEQFMYAGICRKLTETLAEYYTGLLT